jgi:hypothetical protein
MQAERIAEYLRSRLPEATDVSVENVFRIPGGASRETWLTAQEPADGCRNSKAKTGF